MSVARFKRNICSQFASKYSQIRSIHAASNNEYTTEPVYPEIIDLSKEQVLKRLKQQAHEEIAALDTIEEKLFKINMPKYYGWKCAMLNENRIPLHSLPFIQHCTRTHFIQQPTLPESYIAYDSAASFISKQIRSEIEDAIHFEYQGTRRKFTLSDEGSVKRQEEDFMAKSVLHQINRILMNHLSANSPHLMDSQVDIEPRHESSWFVGSFEAATPPKIKKDTVTRPENTKREDHPIQYISYPFLTLRSSMPLEPIYPYSDADNPSLDVPFYNLDPRTLAIMYEYRHCTSIPGFWPGDSHEFGLLSYHTRGHIHDRPASYGPVDTADTINAQGIINSFSWLMSQACYQGFSTFNEITYPLVTQTIVTNGQLWSLFSYQLNTVLLHDENVINNKLRNICYGTQQLKLFEGIDNDGKLVGFNDDVLKMLIQFYLNTPKEREGVDMKPYLGKDVKVIADIEEDERRNWLENKYKHLVANRPRHLLAPETYLWEWIYKIKFNTRFMEAKRRPFENHINPFKRTLDEHTPEYIPKVLRPGGPKSKKKWAKTFYP